MRMHRVLTTLTLLSVGLGGMIADVQGGARKRRSSESGQGASASTKPKKREESGRSGGQREEEKKLKKQAADLFKKAKTLKGDERKRTLAEARAVEKQATEMKHTREAFNKKQAFNKTQASRRGAPSPYPSFDPVVPVQSAVYPQVPGGHSEMNEMTPAQQPPQGYATVPGGWTAPYGSGTSRVSDGGVPSNKNPAQQKSSKRGQNKKQKKKTEKNLKKLENSPEAQEKRTKRAARKRENAERGGDLSEDLGGMFAGG